MSNYESRQAYNKYTLTIVIYEKCKLSLNVRLTQKSARNFTFAKKRGARKTSISHVQRRIAPSIGERNYNLTSKFANKLAYSTLTEKIIKFFLFI